MKIIVERPFKAFQHIDDLRKTSLLQRFAGKNRAAAAAADQHDRPCHIPFDQALHVVGKMRIDFPIRRFLPGHMLGADRMTDVHVLDFRPAINQHGIRRLLQKGMSGKGIEMLHGLMGKLEWSDIMKARERKA